MGEAGTARRADAGVVDHVCVVVGLGVQDGDLMVRLGSDASPALIVEDHDILAQVGGVEMDEGLDNGEWAARRGLIRVMGRAEHPVAHQHRVKWRIWCV